MNSLGVHAHTPDLAVIDPRGLAVRAVAYCRALEEEPSQAHITRQVFDPLGRAVAQFDPRLFSEGLVPNRGSVHGLSAVELLATRVDAGWVVALTGEAGQLVQRWDSRGSQQRGYDNRLRPVLISEQFYDERPRVAERFEYGGVEGHVHNQCGQLIRHDDPATTRHMPDYSVQGLSLLEASHFLASLEAVDWPEDIAARDALLETAPGLDSRWAYDALGEVAAQTDAMGNRRRMSRTCAGQLGAVHLQRLGADEVLLVSDIRYSASGLVEQERAGNGVITRAEFRPEDARLEHLSAGLPGQALLQDLHYAYDPVGNPVQIDDRSKPVTWFKNQQIDPVCTYTYDSRYRLIGATGREVFHAANDPNALVNYREEYDYDAGNNALELRHLGVQPFTRRWAVDEASNRSIIFNSDDPPPDFAEAFDGNGNQTQLLPGQTMGWDTRNQLSEVSPVTRDDGPDDTESYRYGGGGKRLRKVRQTLASGRTLIGEVRYLPGLEVHRTAKDEERHVLEIEAGRNTVRLQHWVGEPPTGVDNDHLSYSLTDHLHSGLLELDEQGAVISDEGYLPFGGRAWWVAHHGAKASYKTWGYSGKQRDATGLIYYGYRYYAPWQQRWINPDPAGEVDGLNLYCFVGNSPVRYIDRNGWAGEDAIGPGQQQLEINVEEVSSTAVNRFQERFIVQSLEHAARRPVPPGASMLAPPPVAVAPPGEPPNEVLSPSLLHDFVQFVEGLIASGTDSRSILANEPAGTTTNNSPVTAPQPSTSRGVDGTLPPANSTIEVGTFIGQPGPGSEYVCETCGRGFNRIANLRLHVSTHSLERPHVCVTCGAAFKSAANLIVHKKFHAETRSHVCVTCNKTFATTSDLDRHSRVHTGVRPYTCSTCGKAFKGSANLSRHQDVHTGARRFRCPTCNKYFVRKSVLTVHQRRYDHY